MRVLLIAVLICGFHSYPFKFEDLPFDIFENLLQIQVDPDVNRNVSQLISSKGYPVENYEVQTKDGYILSVQRIPHGLKKPTFRASKQPIFLLHGLLSSAVDWVINNATQSLGFILADAGYDVWLGNVRGNTYSRKHASLSPDSAKFWQFSFDEMAEFDLPAMIDFILNKTGQPQVIHIGHSQGTATAFAMLSESAEYNKKVKLMIGLAPVTTVGYITTAIRYLVPFTTDVKLMFELLGVHEFLPSGVIMKYLSEFVCDTKIKELCADVIFLLCGDDMAQLNMTRLQVYTSHSPAGTSTQNIIHWAQLVKSKKFQKYDFGKYGNLFKYGQRDPTEYLIENITTPVAIFWSKNDKLADPTDVGLLEKKLKTLVSSTCVDNPLFNHLDFVWGIDANRCIYDSVLDLLKKYAS